LKLFTKHNFKLVTEHHFQLSFGGETVTISFEARQFSKLPSELVFAQSASKSLRLSSLSYGILCINKRVTYITNQVLTSKHEYRFDVFALDLGRTRRLANCKLYNSFCSLHLPIEPFLTKIHFCSKRSHRMYLEPQCSCKLCVKLTCDFKIGMCS
jgi:hypothetical protein